MAAYEILALNESTPQIRAPASGDTATLVAGVALGWSTDLALQRDAANVLALRNTTNAQTLRVYNTYTDASNYERAEIAWISNILFIRAAKAGTGGARPINIRTDGAAAVNIETNGTTRWSFASDGTLQCASDGAYDIGAASTVRPNNIFQKGYSQLSEMTAPAAPAADGVRIYAVDNGGGKTQLMALFSSGAAQQIAIQP